MNKPNFIIFIILHWTCIEIIFYHIRYSCKMSIVLIRYSFKLETSPVLLLLTLLLTISQELMEGREMFLHINNNLSALILKGWVGQMI